MRQVKVISILIATSSLIVGFQNCAPFQQDANLSRSTDSSTQPEAMPAQKFTCTPNATRGLGGYSIRRLTKFELKQTVADIFGQRVADSVESAWGLYPSEAYVESIEEFSPNMNASQVSAMLEIATAVADSTLSTYEDTKRIMPSCMLSSNNIISLSNDSCTQEFLSSIGLKILRRPLSSEQLQGAMSLLKSTASQYTLNRDRVNAALASLMMTPEFSHLILFKNIEGSPDKVDSYALASRISYQMTGSLPDAELFEAARKRELGSEASRLVHARRLAKSPQSRAYVRYVFHHLLELHRDVNLNLEYGNYLGVGRDGLAEELRTEALNFVEHVVFEQNGTFKDLMNSTKAFPVSANSAKVFGTTASSGVQDPKSTTGGHRGLYMRPALMLSSASRTSPIARGVKFTRKVLCNNIPDPDPSVVTQAEEALEHIDVLETTSRQQATLMTSPGACQACHAHINPPGYFFESFGPFGERRSTEAVFNGNGNLVRTLSIDTSVDRFIIDNRARAIADTDDFMVRVANSAQARACLAENVFKYVNIREISKDDSCRLSEMEKAIRDDRPIIETFIYNATSEDQLWERSL